MANAWPGGFYLAFRLFCEIAKYHRPGLPGAGGRHKSSGYVPILRLSCSYPVIAFSFVVDSLKIPIFSHFGVR
jgi:hypothetical protein